jgi:rare lipoprotein A
MNAIAILKNTRSRRLSLLAVIGTVAALGVSAVPTGYAEKPTKQQHHWYQIGVASWYGHFFQGRRTADGEHFDMNSMTCAHRSLPMGSLLRVTNLTNNKSVVVRVNDRGPVPRSRVIDLSSAAARYLGVTGVAKVRIELVMNDTELAQMAFPTAAQ